MWQKDNILKAEYIFLQLYFQTNFKYIHIKCDSERRNWQPEGAATHSSILFWRIPMDRGARQAIVHGVIKSRTQLSD